MDHLTKKIPNCLTLINLCLGVAAIMFVTEESTSLWPPIFILIAALMDTCDGKLARSLNAQSDLGKELDSLCDLVTFGVAPAILLWHASLSGVSSKGAFFVLMYVAAGAYRLARYNVSSDCSVFMGMPITFAGILSALYYMTGYAKVVPVTMAFMAFLAYAMVSRVRFKRIDDYKVICGMKFNYTYYKYKRKAKKATR